MTVLTIISIILIESATAAGEGWFSDSDTVSDVKELVKKEKELNKEEPEYCIKDTLDAVIADKKAWVYMINEICTKVKTRKDAKQYLEDKYEMNAVVPLELNEALFLKLNASECIKESLDVFKLTYYRIIRECVWPKDETTPYLIMDKYTGTFEDKIVNSYGAGWEGKNYPKGKALGDMIEITNELLGLHEKDIAHRDLRPENIMVDAFGTLILGNFDFATPLGAETTKASIESPDPYMDYEMRLKWSQPISSDIYSLFIIFARIFLGDEALDTIKKMIQANSSEPEFGKLSVPDDFKWTENMFKNSLTFQMNVGNNVVENECRWKAQEVLDKLTEMKNNLDLQNLLLI